MHAKALWKAESVMLSPIEPIQKAHSETCQPSLYEALSFRSDTFSGLLSRSETPSGGQYTASKPPCFATATPVLTGSTGTRHTCLEVLIDPSGDAQAHVQQLQGLNRMDRHVEKAQVQETLHKLSLCQPRQPYFKFTS